MLEGRSHISVEFLVEPFEEGNPGRHVRAAIEELVGSGLSVEEGAFGNRTGGSVAIVVPALTRALEAAFTAGATRIAVTLSAD